MAVYADASLLFSPYAQDANTQQAGQISGTFKAPLAFTPFQRHELRNTFQLALFRRDMTAAQRRTLLETIEADTKTGAIWCAREDSNLHPFRDQILSLARLPFRHARNSNDHLLARLTTRLQ